MEKMAQKMGAATEFPFGAGGLCLETEQFKLIADKLLLDAGVKPLLHCWVVGAVMEGSTIKGVITESKSGRKVCAFLIPVIFSFLEFIVCISSR